MSCLFCLFGFHTAALTPSPCSPCFRVNAATAVVVGRGRAVRQGSTAAAAWAQLRPQDAPAAWDAPAPLVPAAASVAVPRRLHDGIPPPGRSAGARPRPRDAPAPLAPAAAQRGSSCQFPPCPASPGVSLTPPGGEFLPVPSFFDGVGRGGIGEQWLVLRVCFLAFQNQIYRSYSLILVNGTGRGWFFGHGVGIICWACMCG